MLGPHAWSNGKKWVATWRGGRHNGPENWPEVLRFPLRTPASPLRFNVLGLGRKRVWLQVTRLEHLWQTTCEVVFISETMRQDVSLFAALNCVLTTMHYDQL